MRRKIENVNKKMVFLDQVTEMANRYAAEYMKVSEQNVMLESQSRLLDLEMCESVKVVENEENLEKKREHMLTTFGFPVVSYKNESICNQVENSSAFEERDGNAFTFKDVCV